MTRQRVFITVTPRTLMRGVSLIELMVSLVIGLLLIAGAVTVYMQSRNTYRINEAAARLQEVGRYALNIIEPDVRLAGFWGLTNRADFVENRGGEADAQQAVDVGVTDNCGNNWTVDLAQFADGRDASGSGYDLLCGAINPVSWADVLVVRRASSDVRPLTNGRTQIQTNRMRGLIFDDGVLPAGFGAAPASETRDLVVHAYYVSEVLPSPNGVRQFQLRRQTLVGGPAVDDIEIIPGIQDVQVQFGVDTTGDGNADLYVNPESVPAGARTAAVRIWLLVLAEDREIGFTNSKDFSYANAAHGVFADDRRRVLMSKTIQIRNSRP